MPIQKLVIVVASLLLLAGCSGMFESQSEYEQMKSQEEGFSKVIGSAGGTAAKEGRAMYGMTAAGWFIDLKGAKITDEVVAAISEVAKKDPVFELKLDGSSITDEQLAKLDKGNVLQKTVVLDLSNTAVTDAGLDSLSNHYIVSELKLKGSKATTAGAKRLGSRQIANPQTPAPFKKQPKVDL